MDSTTAEIFTIMELSNNTISFRVIIKIQVLYIAELTL